MRRYWVIFVIDTTCFDYLNDTKHKINDTFFDVITQLEKITFPDSQTVNLTNNFPSILKLIHVFRTTRGSTYLYNDYNRVKFVGSVKNRYFKEFVLEILNVFLHFT